MWESIKEHLVALWSIIKDLFAFLDRQWLFNYEGDFYRQCSRCGISHHAKYLGREANFMLGWWVLNPAVKNPKPCRCHKYARVLETRP